MDIKEEVIATDTTSIAEGKKKEAFIQFIKFCMVGVCNTLVSYVVNTITIYTMSHMMNFTETDKIVYFSGNILSFIISVFTAFLLSNRFVFKEDKNGEKRVWWKTLVKTYMSYGVTGLILCNIMSFVWIDVIHIGNYLGWLVDLLGSMGLVIGAAALGTYMAPLFNMVFSIPINFVLNKFWAYRQKDVKSV